MPSSFPRAADTFAARVNDTFIDAGHVNDLQDAVAATQGAVSAVSALQPGLRPWHAAVANRQQAPATMVVIGDSNGEGQGAGTEARRWVSLLRDRYRARYPTPGVAGGLGYVPAYYESAITQLVAVAGATATKDTRYGFGARTYQLTNTAVLTWPSATITSAVLHYTRDAFGTTAFLRVDGNQVASVSTNGTPTGNSTLATGALTRASHVVSVTCQAGGFAVEAAGVYLYDQDENAGIHVIDASHFGFTTTSFPATSLWPIATVQPQAVVFALGTNDAIVSSPATFQTNLTALVAAVAAQITGPWSAIFLAEPARNGALFGGAAWSSYVTAMRAVALATTNGVMIDMSSRMPDIAGDVLGLYADTVHLGGKGHSYQADAFVTLTGP